MARSVSPQACGFGYASAMSTPPPSPIYVPGPIWPPDWSQFIPDSIGAIITGAIVGFVLWRVERVSASRRAERDAETQWESRRGALLIAMMSPMDRPKPLSDPERYLVGWNSVRIALDPAIPVWRRDSPKNVEIALAHGMLLSITTLTSLWHDLRVAILLSVIAVEEEPDTPDLSGDDRSRVVDYCLARFLVGSELEARTSFEDVERDIPVAVSLYERVTNDEAVQSKTALMRAAQETYLSTYTEIRRLLRG